VACVAIDTTKDYDIALLKVSDEKGIRLDDYSQPACLPKPAGYKEEGLTCIVSGWGAVAEDGGECVTLG
jgi:hypothetical protein